MRFITFIFFYSINFTLAFSQFSTPEITVNHSDLFEENGMYLDEVIGIDNGITYLLTSKGKGLKHYTFDYFFEKLDEDFKLILKKEISLTYNGKDLEIINSIMNQKNEIFIISKSYDKKDKLISIYISSLDKNTLTSKNDYKLIAEFSNKDFSKFDYLNYTINYSKNSSKILFSYNLPYNKREYDKVGFVVFNDDLEAIWDDEITLPVKEELYLIENLQVDNSGNIYILGQEFKEVPKIKKKGNANYQYKIFRYSFGTKKHKDYIIEVEDNFITDLKIISTDSVLLCLGFYGPSYPSIKGAVYHKIDLLTGKTVFSKTYDYDSSIFTQNLNDKKSSNVEKRIDKDKFSLDTKYEIKDLIVSEDGSILLVGENVYETSHNLVNTVNGTTTTWIFYYKYILVSKFSQDGNLEWVKQLPKNQVSTNDFGKFSSFSVFSHKNITYFLYNDDNRNLDYSAGEKLYQYEIQDSYPNFVMVGLDVDGNIISREPLFNYNSLEVLLKPKSFKKASDNEYVLIGNVRRGYSLTRVKIN